VIFKKGVGTRKRRRGGKGRRRGIRGSGNGDDVRHCKRCRKSPTITIPAAIRNKEGECVMNILGSMGIVTVGYCDDLKQLQGCLSRKQLIQRPCKWPKWGNGRNMPNLAYFCKMIKPKERYILRVECVTTNTSRHVVGVFGSILIDEGKRYPLCVDTFRALGYCKILYGYRFVNYVCCQSTCLVS
jgi:hypothetical protein